MKIKYIENMIKKTINFIALNTSIILYTQNNKSYTQNKMKEIKQISIIILFLIF